MLDVWPAPAREALERAIASVTREAAERWASSRRGLRLGQLTARGDIGDLAFATLLDEGPRALAGRRAAGLGRAHARRPRQALDAACADRVGADGRLATREEGPLSDRARRLAG